MVDNHYGGDAGVLQQPELAGEEADHPLKKAMVDKVEVDKQRLETELRRETRERAVTPLQGLVVMFSRGGVRKVVQVKDDSQTLYELLSGCVDSTHAFTRDVTRISITPHGFGPDSESSYSLEDAKQQTVGAFPTDVFGKMPRFTVN